MKPIKKRTSAKREPAVGRRMEPPEMPESLVSQAYKKILDRIVRLELEPGRAFTEGDLANELGLSKTPVREALLMLRVRGLVFPRPRSGYWVTPITIRDVRDLFGILRIIEPECAALSASRGLSASRLLYLEGLEVSVDRDDPTSIDNFIDAEINVRRVLAYESGNERLFVMSDLLVYELARQLRLSVELAPPGDTLVANHEKLMAAIVGGDSSVAREIALERVELMERFILDTLLESDAVQGVNVRVPEAHPYRDSL